MGTIKRIVLTRSQGRNRPWAEQLKKAGHALLKLPLTEHRPLLWQKSFGGKKYDWLMFTSPTAVEHFVAGADKQDGRQIAALGSGTYAALQASGWQTDYRADAHDGREFAQSFMAKYEGPLTILLPGPSERLAEPGASLSAAGYSVTELALYETCQVAPTEKIQPDDIVFFCSPSAVRSFVLSFSERPNCVAIGETTATICRAENFPTKVAASPDLTAMIEAAGLSH